MGQLFPTGHSWMWPPPIYSAQLLLKQMEVSLSNISALLIRRLVADTPELTPSSTIPTGTVSESATPTVALSPPLHSGSSDSHKSNTGAIAGGVVGGLVGLALIAGAVVFFMRRRQAGTALSSAQGPPSEAPLNSPPLMQQFSQPSYDQTTYNGSNQYVSNHPQPLYNPDDPSTWPDTRVDISDIHTTASGPGQLPYSASQPGHYNGVPEV